MNTNPLMKPFKGSNCDYYSFNYFYAQYQASQGKHSNVCAAEVKQLLEAHLQQPVPNTDKHLGVNTLRELYEDSGQFFEIRWEDIPEEYTANRNLFREILEASEHQPVMFFSATLMKTLTAELDQ